MDNSLIRIEHVTKHYNGAVVLDDINLTIEKGECAALTGHNGCGKSTLLKITAGLVRADRGGVRLPKKRRFQYIPEHFPKLPISARSYLKHAARLDGLAETVSRDRIAELSRMFFISDLLDIPLKHLSKGTLQKVGVVQAFLMQPDVLLLDEPLSGQDIDSQRIFLEQAERMKEAGVTIIMSCHEPYLVSRLADTVYKGADHTFRKTEIDRIDENSLDVLLFDLPSAETQLEEQTEGMVAHISYRQDQVKILVSSSHSNEMIRTLLEQGYTLREMHHE